MKNNNYVSADVAVGWVGLLGVSLIVLKLTGVINWSWWIVTIPFWGGLGTVAVAAIGLLFFLLIHKIITCLNSY
jgi:hypothetical protein